MSCADCGTSLDDDARFCPNCGCPAPRPLADAPHVPGHAVLRPLPARGVVRRFLVRAHGGGGPREVRVVPRGDDEVLAAARRRELERAHLLQSVRDDALPRVHHAGTAEDADLLVVTDLPEGESLAERLATRGPLAPGEVARLVDDLANALTVTAVAGHAVESLEAGDVLLLSRSSQGEEPRAFLLDVTLALPDPGSSPPARGKPDPSAPWGAATRALAVLAWSSLETSAGGVNSRLVPARSSADSPGGTTRPASTDRARLRSLLGRTVAGRRRGATTPLELAAGLAAALRGRRQEVGTLPARRRPAAPPAAPRRAPVLLAAAAAAVALTAAGLLVHWLRPDPAPVPQQASGTHARASASPSRPVVDSSGPVQRATMPSTRDASGLHALAAATAARGEPETAAALFDAAVTASRLGAASGGPARPDLLCDAAVAWATLGDLGRAAVLLDQSLRLQPGHARALANRAALALVAGQHSSAEADARAALGQEEGLAVAHAALIGSLRAQGRELEASAAAAVSVELGLDSAGLRLQWAALATDAGDALAAREHLDAAARLAPGTSLSASR